MANISFKFDMKKFEKNLTKEIEKNVKKKQRELIAKYKIMRKGQRYEYVTKKRRRYVINNAI